MIKEGWKDKSSKGRPRKDEEPNSGTEKKTAAVFG